MPRKKQPKIWTVVAATGEGGRPEWQLKFKRHIAMRLERPMRTYPNTMDEDGENRLRDIAAIFNSADYSPSSVSEVKRRASQFFQLEQLAQPELDLPKQ